MDYTLLKGDVNELQCILDFQKRGYYCSLPFSGSCRYDVIADIDGILIRVQCKASSYYPDNGILMMHTTRVTTNTKGNKKYVYTTDDADYFYTSWNNYGFLIPVTSTTGCYIRVKEPLGGLQRTMNIGSDYLMDKIIDEIKHNKEFQKFYDNRIISIDKDGNEKLWSSEDLSKIYTDRQIRYIKEKAIKNDIFQGLIWKYKEFPNLI